MNDYLYYGQGRVYLSGRNADGNPVDLVWICDCSSLELNLASVTRNKTTSVGGRRHITDVQTTETNATVSIAASEYSPDNMARALYATQTRIDAGRVTEQLPANIQAGDRIPLKYSSVWGVEIEGLTQGEDYTLDPLFGALLFMVTPASGLSVSYYHAGIDRLALMATLPENLYLRYESLDIANIERLLTLDLYKIYLSPADIFTLLTNENQFPTIDLTARVLADTSRAGTDWRDMYGCINNISRYDGTITLSAGEANYDSTLPLSGQISVNFDAVLKEVPVNITAVSTAGSVIRAQVETDAAGAFATELELDTGEWVITATAEMVSPTRSIVHLTSAPLTVQMLASQVVVVLQVTNPAHHLFIVADGDEGFTIDYGDGIDSYDYRLGDVQNVNGEAYRYVYSTRELSVDYFNLTIKRSSTARFGLTISTSPQNRLTEIVSVSGRRTSMKYFACRALYLTKIHTGVFEDLFGTTDFSYMLYYCTGLTELPDDLLINCVEAVNFSYFLYYCRNMKRLPARLFANLNRAEDFTYTLAGMSNLEELPGDLLLGCTGAKFFNYFCNNNTALSGLPARLLKDCINAINFTSSWAGCSGLLSIPQGFFEGLIYALTFEGTFQNCGGVQAVPARLCAYCAGAVNFYRMFYGCHGIKTIEEDVYLGCISAANYNSTYQACTGLTTVASGHIPASATILFSTFEGCSQLVTDINVICSLSFYGNAENLNRMYYNCQKVTGSAITFMKKFVDNVPAYSAFYRATALDDYDLLPSDWI